MLNIADLFKKVQNRQSKEVFFRTTIQEIINSQVHILIPIECIISKSDTIQFEGISSTARSQIYIKKQSIVAEINKRQQIKKVVDIR